jgi:RNA polymerase sigma-B factor
VVTPAPDHGHSPAIDPGQHLRLARWLAARWVDQGRLAGAAPWVDADDLYAAALLGLVKAARRWDPARGVRWSTYATVVCEHELADLLHPARRHAFHEVSLDSTPDGSDLRLGDTLPAESAPDPLEAVSSDERALPSLVAAAQLDRRERLVLGVYRRGGRGADAGRKLGVHPSMANRLLRRAIVKIAAARRRTAS